MAGEPDLAEVISAAIENRLLDVHTSVPGIVQSYDRATQTCDVLIAVQRADQKSDGETVFTEQPIVPHVPVAWPGGGGFHFACPLKKGDSVWLVFSEAATGPYRNSGDVSVPGDLRRHSLASAVAIPCNPVSSKAFSDAGSNTEAVIVVPSGGTLRVSESGHSSDFVALAAKVDANFAQIDDLFKSPDRWIVAPNDGGAALKTAAADLNFESVAAATLKVQ